VAIDVAKAWNAVLIEKRDGTHQHFRVANSHGASVRHFEPTRRPRLIKSSPTKGLISSVSEMSSTDRIRVSVKDSFSVPGMGLPSSLTTAVVTPVGRPVPRVGNAWKLTQGNDRFLTNPSLSAVYHEAHSLV